ncbi:GGDEF domain-containing protein [Vibrio sp. JC009]|uniref:sensor domain-containing diguanylate cyclase n=1 Tax=Vibrio sp. JC009 TaxID=2912314 RepID=UPI0023AEF931|nr:sensor domain-containing diguanylate cyclase [Vibrio sp. JC009]WED22958.1 GGDEF domain-containing protein [Vibrio sp. JC009]
MEKQELRLLRDVIRGIPELVLVVTENGEYLEIAGVSGHNPENIVGHSVRELFPETVSSQFIDALQEAFSDPEAAIKTIEYRLEPSPDLKIELPGNRPRTFELKINPLTTIHKGARIAVCICRDLTETRDNEKQLLDLSQRDYLTGIYNRIKVIEQLTQSYNEFFRYETSACFLLIDIDNFKTVNDRYGHLAGDAAICHFTQLCQHEHRAVDTFGRLGGDEFGLVLPNISVEEASSFAARIKNLVQDNVCIYKDIPIPFSISVGISDIQKNDTGIEAVINRADQAMYHSKYQGRNQITVHDRL